MIRHTTLLFLLLAGALSVGLFSIKYQVQDLEQQLVTVNKSILQERREIHVLHAEWSYLNNPERLAGLAVRLLHMQPILPSQLASLDDMDVRLGPLDGVGAVSLTVGKGAAQ